MAQKSYKKLTFPGSLKRRKNYAKRNFWTKMVPNILLSETEVKECIPTVNQVPFFGLKWLNFVVFLEYKPRPR